MLNFYNFEELLVLFFILAVPIMLIFSVLYFTGRSPKKVTLFKLKWLNSVTKELQEKGIIDSKLSEDIQNGYIKQKISECSAKHKNLLSVAAIIFVTIGILLTFFIEWGGIMAERIKAITAVAIGISAIFISFYYKDKQELNQKFIRLTAFLGTAFSGVAMILISRSLTFNYTWGMTFLIWAVISLGVLLLMRNIENWIIFILISVVWMFMEYNMLLIFVVIFPVCILLFKWSLFKQRQSPFIASVIIFNLLTLLMAYNNNYSGGVDWFRIHITFLFPVFILAGSVLGIYIKSIIGTIISLSSVCIWYAVKIQGLMENYSGHLSFAGNYFRQIFLISLLLFIITIFYVFQAIYSRNSKQIFSKVMKALISLAFIIMAFIVTELINQDFFNINFMEILFQTSLFVALTMLILISSAVICFIFNIIKSHKYKFLNVENYLVMFISVLSLFVILDDNIVKHNYLFRAILLNASLIAIGVWLIITGKAFMSKYNILLGISIITLKACIFINIYAGLFVSGALLFITAGITLLSFARSTKLNINNNSEMYIKGEGFYESR